MKKPEHLTLKWGTLKKWRFGKWAKPLLEEYSKIGSSMSGIMQYDTPRQKEIVCELIEKGNFKKVYLDWDGKEVTKLKAKKYVMQYANKSKLMKPLIKKMFWLPPKTIDQIKKEAEKKKISGSALLLHIINNWFSK